MIRRSRKPAALRDTWTLPPDDGSRGRLMRRLRRLLAALCLALLCGFFAYLLIAPFWHPMLHPVVATSAYEGINLPGLPYAWEDAAAIRAPLGPESDGGPEHGVHVLRASSDLRQLDASLTQLPSGRRDLTVIYLAAHGIVMDGVPYLLCQDFDPANPESGRFPLRAVLDRLAQSTAGAKLLVLDAGRLDYDPRLGVVVNEFPRLLQTSVRELADRRLWVLASHSPLERALTLHARRQSAFGRFVTQGLGGAGDLNGDGLLHLSELHQFVQQQLSRYAHSWSGGRLTQTPLLLQGGQDEPDLSAAPLLRAVGGLDLVASSTEKTSPKTAASPPREAGAAPAAPDAQTPPQTTDSEDQASATPPNASPAVGSTASTGSKETLGGTEPPPAASRPASPLAASARVEISNITIPGPKADATEMLAAARRVTTLYPQQDTGFAPHPLTVAAPAWKAWRTVVGAQEAALRADGRTDVDALARAVRRDLLAITGLPATDPTELPSPLLAGLAALRSPAPLTPAQAPTWALAERQHAWDGSALPAPVAALVAKLDQLLTEGDDAAWRELAQQAWPAAADRYAELRFARRLFRAPGLTLALRRAAWRSARQAEAVAADPWATVTWIRRHVEAGDTQRLAGERGLRDQLGPDWRAAALDRLERAASEYSAARRGLDELYAALQTRNAALDRASQYLHWFHAAAGDDGAGPAYEDLVAFFAQLEQLCTLLEQLDTTDLATLVNQHDQLRLTCDRLESPLRPAALTAWLNSPAGGAGQEWRAEILLRSGLLPDEFAQRCWEVARQASFDEKPAIAAGGVAAAQAKIITDDDWTHAARQLALELRWARLVLPGDDRGELRRLETIVAGEAPEIARGATPGPLRGQADDLWRMWRESGAALARIRGGVASRASQYLEENSDLRVNERRAASLLRLREADRLVRLIDARDVARLGDADPAARLRRAAWYDLMEWQRSRALAALSDAPPDEAADALAQASLCRRLAQEFPQEPVLADSLPPLPIVDGSAELPLVTDAQRDFSLRLRPPPGYRGPVWLVLAFDAELLDASARDVPAVTETELREKLAATARASSSPKAGQAADYPVRPADAGVAPSWEIVGGAARDLRLNVRRKVAVGRSSRLIVKFIGQDFAVRHEVAVSMSALDAIALVPSGFPGSWSQRESHLQLHPLPNQRTEYRFALVNQGEATKTVDVELVALRQPLRSPSVLALPAQDALDAIGPTDPILRVPQLKLPADGQPVPLAPPGPPAKAADAADQTSLPPATRDRRVAGLDATGDPGTNGDGAADPPPTAAAPVPNAAGPLPLQGQRMNHGVLLIMRERETMQTLFRLIEFRPLHPRAFLSVNAGYDPLQQRIELVVKPRDRDLIPPQGLKVRCETPEPLPTGTEARLEGLLTAPQFEARLYLRVPAEDGRVQRVSIDVDGYPRAFFYRVPCGVASANLPEDDAVLAVRVLAPPPGQWYKAPVESIPVRVEVDAPRGSFANDRDLIEIGLDADRDRELLGEVVQPFAADRQAEVATPGFVGPVLAVDTRIGDFHFDLPTGGLRNVRANVLGRAQVGSRVAWSEPVEIVLDGAPPVVRRVQISPETPVVADGEIEVVVGANDGQMSGVDVVEVGLDPRLEGKFGGAAPPVQATPSEPTVWKARLPLQGVEAGPTQILVRATDKAGNASDYTKLQVTVLPKAAAEAAKTAQRGRITGEVRYGDRPIPGAEVTLEGDLDPKTKKRPAVATTKADAQGQFTFASVAVGKYQVRARGLANNRTRLGAQEVTVPPPPAQTPAVLIKAK